VAFHVAELNEAIEKIAGDLDKAGLAKKEVDAILKRRDKIMADREKLVKEMGDTKYLFHLKGISEGTRQDLYDKALEKYPMEYEKNRNPFTNEQEKIEVDNVERDRYFTALLWEAYIVKIVAPDGSEQEGINLEEAEELRKSMPLASITAITEAIEKMRAATALFMMSVNEDFLAKS
jgi:hypothetical protein